MNPPCANTGCTCYQKDLPDGTNCLSRAKHRLRGCRLYKESTTFLSWLKEEIGKARERAREEATDDSI